MNNIAPVAPVGDCIRVRVPQYAPLEAVPLAENSQIVLANESGIEDDIASVVQPLAANPPVKVDFGSFAPPHNIVCAWFELKAKIAKRTVKIFCIVQIIC